MVVEVWQYSRAHHVPLLVAWYRVKVLRNARKPPTAA